MTAVALLGAGCTINRDIMFKTPRDFAFDTVQDTLEREFKLQPDDIIAFKMYANDGFKMIDLINQDDLTLRSAQRDPFSYLVDPRGITKLPVIGEVHVQGLTVRQAEMLLEDKYSTFFKRPFVLLSVSNRRVVVFPGGGGDAKIVPLENNNTTLLEVLARAGGIASRGDAHRVKLFRKEADGMRKIFQFDLSDIENLKYGDLVMQADDVLYVQPNAEIARGLLTEITPLITLLTTTVLVIGLVRTIGN